jgi:hypothetical protein
MLKITGYVILILSCLLFLSIPVIPFLGFTGGRIAAITTGLFIAGEVTFYTSLIILGKTFYEKLKSKFRFRKSRKNEKDISDKSEQNEIQ